MLRVRPVLLTSRLDAYAALLRRLGLPAVASDGAGSLFGGAHGMVELCPVPAGHAADGRWALGFEIRDATIFVRRTLADGTPAGLVPGGARVTAPDGGQILAHAVAADAPRTPEQALTVVAHWHTPTPEAAGQMLRNIGARPLAQPPGTGLFTAKNGGRVSVQRADRDAVVLGFHHDGELAALRSQLSPHSAASLRSAELLHVPTPDGAGWDIQRARF